jgi:hypothetical protein
VPALQDGRSRIAFGSAFRRLHAPELGDLVGVEELAQGDVPALLPLDRLEIALRYASIAESARNTTFDDSHW